MDDLGGSDLGRDVPTVVHADGLSAGQRLLLGMVLFGPVTYGQAADRTGLTPAQVSQLCAAALRQLAVAGRPADTALGYDCPGQPDRYPTAPRNDVAVAPVRTLTGPALAAETWRCENCGHDSRHRRRRCADCGTSRHGPWLW